MLLKIISNHLKKIFVPLMKIHNKLIKSKTVTEKNDFWGNLLS